MGNEYLRIIIVLLMTAQISPQIGQQVSGTDIDPFNFKGEYQLDSTKLTPNEKTALPYAQKMGESYGISPALIMAIISHESTFNANAVGDGGLAIGYMQLHWDAAYDAGDRSSRGNSKELAQQDWPTNGKNPDLNIQCGCGYLNLCHKKCSNSAIYAGDALENTLSAYNKGWPHGPDRDNEYTYVNPIIDKYNKYKQFILNPPAAVAGASMGFPITLALCVHSGSADGPAISGSATVTGQDGAGNRFERTSDNDGFVLISGTPGTWSFTASAPGYETKTWSQEITETDTRHVFVIQPSHETQPASSIVGEWNFFYTFESKEGTSGPIPINYVIIFNDGPRGRSLNIPQSNCEDCRGGGWVQNGDNVYWAIGEYSQEGRLSADLRLPSGYSGRLPGEFTGKIHGNSMNGLTYFDNGESFSWSAERIEG
ncbi:MAG: transglycosylase SLT domain-containing protein [Methanotrichaceae archaeon]|nr:transglycosylase SLT domain-containing protein [Methanotrichaceae archaeon]